MTDTCNLAQSGVIASNFLTLSVHRAMNYCDLLQSNAIVSNSLLLAQRGASHGCELLQSNVMAGSALLLQMAGQGSALSHAKAYNLAEIEGSALAPDFSAFEYAQESDAALSNPYQLTQSLHLDLLSQAVVQSLLQVDGGSSHTAEALEQQDSAAAQNSVQLAAARYWQQADSVTASNHLQFAGEGAADADDTASAQNPVSISAQRSVQAQDSAGVSDSLQVTAHHRIDIVDSVGASDGAQVTTAASYDLLDDLLAQSLLQADGDIALLWTAKTDSLAMSIIEPAEPLNALAVVQGELAASNAGGLHRFSAAATAPSVQTGWLYPESGLLWRAEYAYLMHSGEPLTLHLTASDGTEQTYSYTTDPRTADVPVPSRIRLGRGIRSGALRLGVSGADFALQSGELALTDTSRKL